jgi:hypothetical protein
MSISSDLTDVASLCNTSAQIALGLMLGMGPRPTDPAQGLLWDQQTTRLQGTLNSLTALVSKLTADSVIAGLQNYTNEMDTVSNISKSAEDRIKSINNISNALTKIANVLDLGLAIVAAAAAPSPVTIAAVVTAGAAVANGV